MRILIAEDEYTSRVTLVAMLLRMGHEVVETVNGVAAWEELQKINAPRIALLDWMMPEMDGMEVVSNIRAHENVILPISGTPAIKKYIIMLTAKSEKEDIITGLKTGADDYLAKPYLLDELQARIEVGQRTLKMQEQLIVQINHLQHAQEHIKTLQGILPICMHCKNIRSDTGYWDRIEEYISKHTEALFSHGICPDCMNKIYPEFEMAV